MINEKSQDEIRNDILSRLPKDIDTTARSPLYILAGASAKEHALLRGDINYSIEQSFYDSCDRDSLIRHASPYGISPYPATPSIAEGEFDIEIPVGSRFSKEDVNFTVTEFLRFEEPYYYYRMECEQIGDIGNVATGRILPIQIINNLTHSELTQILIPAENEEDTESFRERFISSLKNKAFCGNPADYFQEIAAISGVGKFKLLRCMNNKGEIEPEWVTIVFTDSDFHKPSDELVKQVQDHFQELDEDTHLPSHKTSGTGLSPIGQLCWVEGVKERSITVGLGLSYEAGYNFGNLKEKITQALTDLFLDYIKNDWGDTVLTKKAYTPLDTYVLIKQADIIGLLIDIEGIQDVTDVSLNGEYRNLSLEWNEIPKLVEVTEFELSQDLEPGDCTYTCPDCLYNLHDEICPRIHT